MDELDRAQEREEEMRADALAQRRPVLAACGACHYCDEPLPAGRLFCDADCRDEWQRLDDARRRNGR